MIEEYNVYSKFNINKHAEKFINYLEVVISPNGEVFYAVPSHTIFLENILKNNYGIEKYRDIINCEEAFNDWNKFLCENTGYCLVWNNFYICSKKGLTKQQKEMLTKLKVKKYNKINLTLYQGDI